eukprot:TRINITY_DN14393_c0_g1_i1.p1 TRINITY_DN14393_c0_g1~~TRINITY_DN14393_c0_g1_i1.p1  ORF type:complete len:305 (-),score=80.12 TRINITY_DN14393_c0_g1_i1:71-985(-)
MKEINGYKQGFKMGGTKNSECYLVTKDRKTYCLKKMKVNKSDLEKIKKIENEIEIMKILNCHKNIIKMEDSFKIDKRDSWMYCIVTEALRMNLAQYIKSKRKGMLKERTCKKIFKQLLKAVEFMHLNYICHNDIKLENVMINPENMHIKLIDFGMSTIAQNEDELMKMKEICGSPMYISPEKFSFSSRDYDGRKSDTWSCGILLFKMLTGSFPFQIKTDDLLDLSKAICNDKLIIPKDTSEPIKSLLNQLLCKEPEERPFISNTLDHEWIKKRSDKLSCSSFSMDSFFFNLVEKQYSNHLPSSF